ncbi:MAG: hypothetical protein ACJ79H_21090 [Myxococcales bacterium]
MRTAILIVVTSAFISACGGSGGGTPSGPLDVTLTAAGPNPKQFSALSQATLRFVNNDAVNHQIGSTNCPGVATPVLTPGANATATLPAGPRDCDFSDTLNPSAAAFQGSINILAPGNGY